MSRMSIRKSTRHFLIDDSKINLDDQDPPPIIGDSIQPNDAWVQAYQKMIDSGWDWLAGSGLSDYHYLKPGISDVKGKVLNVDYFLNEEHIVANALHSKNNQYLKFCLLLQLFQVLSNDNH